MSTYNIKPLQRESKSDNERRLNDLKSQLNQIQLKMTTVEGRIKQLPARLLREANNIPDSAIWGSYIKTCAHTVENLLRTEDNTHSTLVSQKNANVTTIRQLQDKIKAASTGDIIWDTDALNTELKHSCKFYVPESFQVHEAHSLMAKWKLTGIRMRPTHNPFINVVVPEDGILLPDIEITYYPSNGSIFVKHVGEKPTWDDGWGGLVGRVHPHIMSDYQPCFGNFAATKFQCSETADLVSLNLLMVIFLQAANTVDSSGKHWPSHITKQFTSKKTEWDFHLSTADGDDEDYYEMLELPFYIESGLSKMLLIIGATDAEEFEKRLDAEVNSYPEKGEIPLGLKNARAVFKKYKTNNGRIILTDDDIRDFSNYSNATKKCLYGVQR